MICEDSKGNLRILEAIIWFHQNNCLPYKPPIGMRINRSNLLEIDYGFQNKKSGFITIKRGEYNIIEVSQSGKAIQVIPNSHNYTNKTRQDYYEALENTNLNSNNKHLSAITIIISESCKSRMVAETMHCLFTSKVAFSDIIWKGLTFAFSHYPALAKFLSIDIYAKKRPWRWVTSEDFIKYSSSLSINKNEKQNNIEKISAVEDYIINSLKQ